MTDHDSAFEEARQAFMKKYPHGQCEVLLCDQSKWKHPQKGWLCVCEPHFREIEAGTRRVPPLRRNLDYCSTTHPPLLIADLNLENEKP